MRLAWFHFVVIAVLFSSMAGAQAPIKALGAIGPEGFEYGTFANNTYTSDCLGFSLPIPRGMEITIKVPPGTNEWITPTRNGMISLLTMARYMEQPKFGFESIAVAISPVKDPAETAEDFVAGLGEVQVINAKPQGGQLIRGAFAVEYGGKHFFRADYKRPANNGSAYMAFVYTKFRGYFIGETLGARTPEELEEAASSLEHISFQEEAPNSKCATGVADDNPGSTGPFSSIISALPKAPLSNSGQPQRVRVSQGVSTGLLIKKVQPQYPDDARQAGIQGQVVLQALIDKNGDVVDLKLVSGDPALASAANEAVKQWKYKPYLLNGNPVMVETQVVVNFQLSGR